MAFLSSASRFGPQFDRVRHDEPDPFTYTPALSPPSSPSASRYGTFGEHHDPVESRRPMSNAAATLAAASASLAATPATAPAPWDYTPTHAGQFPRVLTTADLDEQRRQQRIATAPRRLHQESAASAKQRPRELQQLALGPGSYELDKDWNLETIAVPFSFGKETRRGILDCCVRVRDLHTDRRRQAKYAPGLSPDQCRRSEKALLPPSLETTAAASQRQHQHAHVRALSKELAKTYEAMARSSTRLARAIASPDARSVRFQRFATTGASDVEAYRRGPGVYFARSSRGSESESRQELTPLPAARNADQAAAVAAALSPSTSLPLDEEQRQQLETLLSRARINTASHDPAARHHAQAKAKATTFGRVRHRDLLTSMTRAGHLSATAIEAAIAPGVYETATSAFRADTHNLLYKAQVRKSATSGATKESKPAARRGDNQDQDSQDASPQDARERWRELRRGPQLAGGDNDPRR